MKNMNWKEIFERHPVCQEVFNYQNCFENETAFGKLITAKKELPREVYAACLRRLFQSDTDGVKFETLLRAFDGIKREDIMYDEELAKFETLPDVISIYRGTQNQDELKPRISWSLKVEIAKIYAAAHLFKTSIPKSRASAYFSSNSDEEEIVAFVNEGEYQIIY